MSGNGVGGATTLAREKNREGKGQKGIGQIGKERKCWVRKTFKKNDRRSGRKVGLKADRMPDPDLPNGKRRKSLACGQKDSVSRHPRWRGKGETSQSRVARRTLALT